MAGNKEAGKFLEFTNRSSGKRIAVNVDKIAYIADTMGTEIVFVGEELSVTVLENYNAIIKQLNEIK